MTNELKAPDDLAGELARLVEKAEGDGKTMRFSKVEAGYQWGAVTTNCIARMQFLLACWNGRSTILAALTTDPALIAENARLLCEINALKDALAHANGGSHAD